MFVVKGKNTPCVYLLYSHTTTHFTSDTVSMGFLHTKQFSATPAECPIFNFDTVSLELPSDFIS